MKKITRKYVNVEAEPMTGLHYPTSWYGYRMSNTVRELLLGSEQKEVMVWVKITWCTIWYKRIF